MSIQSHKTHTSTQRINALLHFERCRLVAKELAPMLNDNHGCGWFDGGCYTLAKAVTRLMDGVEIYHVSRKEEYRDHAVVRLTGFDVYFDADGVHSAQSLKEKMYELELAHCEALAPFMDFDNHGDVEVFDDVVRAFQSQF